MNPEKITKERLALAVAVGLCIFLMYRDSQRRDDGGDAGSIRELAHEAGVRQAHEQGAMFAAAAKGIAEGKITTDRELLEWFQKHRDHAASLAWEDFNGEVQRLIGRRTESDPFDVRMAENLCEQAGAGLMDVR